MVAKNIRTIIRKMGPVLLVYFSTLCNAQESSLDPETWYDSIQGNLDKLVVPRIIALAEEPEGALPKIKSIKPPWLEDTSFITIVDKSYFDLFEQTNRSEFDGLDLLNLDQWQYQMIDRYRISGVIDTSTKPWYFYFRSGDAKRKYKVGFLQKITGKSVLEAIIKSLGYSGVILDKKDGLLLVAEIEKFQISRQALVVEKSKDKMKLARSDKGKSIIEKIAGTGNIGIYKDLLGDGPNEIGSKIIHSTAKTE